MIPRWRPQLFGLLAGLFLAAGLVASALLVSQAWLRISESQTITVTGSARRMVQSDLIVWHGSFAHEASSLLEAQRALAGDRLKVESFLQSHQVEGYQFSSIEIRELRASARSAADPASSPVTGYRLTQSVEVRSVDVGRLASLDQHTTDLVAGGVLFTASPPQFIYTKAGEAKIEMLAEATRDARQRAEQIATQGGRGLRALRQARMGVFQITPVHSLQTSWEGMNDTSSLDKTITAVVTAVFSLR
jgi:hypothetical protein